MYRVDKDADGRITKEEIKETICLSATTNKPSSIQQQAKEYTALIMEELDPEEIGFIMYLENQEAQRKLQLHMMDCQEEMNSNWMTHQGKWQRQLMEQQLAQGRQWNESFNMINQKQAQQ
ncbi:hypothetical protein Ahy_A03g013078 [Arachis hypogaea]|uniref:EF-hand domain-containing protein n=1 Tax=Arachis hypogaea TaxID=3818 RepID=A0A445DUR1_ARAHY|nr:hypothetical protein Ahy_A03g013078 [Arachis hypogaea]